MKRSHSRRDEESEECYRKRKDYKRGDDHKESRHNGDDRRSRHQDDHGSSRRNDEYRNSRRDNEHKTSRRDEKLKKKEKIVLKSLILKEPTYANENYDKYGFPKNKTLEKYDEVIDVVEKDSFVLGANNAVEFKRRQIETVKQRLANIKIDTLQIAEPKLTNEYYNEEELAKFKKPKKNVRKIRMKKKLKDNDTLDVDELEAPTEDLTGIKLEEEDKELELHLALKKTYCLKNHSNDIQKTIETMKQEILNFEENQSGNIVLNSTAEFGRTLDNIPTYGLDCNREENGQKLVDGIKDESSANEEENDHRKNAAMDTLSSSRVMLDEEVVNGLVLCDNYLPVEMLMVIFCHTDYKTLLNCRLVCRRWKMLIEESKIWEKERYELFLRLLSSWIGIPLLPKSVMPIKGKMELKVFEFLLKHLIKKPRPGHPSLYMYVYTKLMQKLNKD